MRLANVSRILATAGIPHTVVGFRVDRDIVLELAHAVNQSLPDIGTPTWVRWGKQERYCRVTWLREIPGAVDVFRHYPDQAQELQWLLNNVLVAVLENQGPLETFNPSLLSRLVLRKQPGFVKAMFGVVQVLQQGAWVTRKAVVLPNKPIQDRDVAHELNHAWDDACKRLDLDISRGWGMDSRKHLLQPAELRARCTEIDKLVRKHGITGITFADFLQALRALLNRQRDYDVLDTLDAAQGVKSAQFFWDELREIGREQKVNS